MHQSYFCVFWLIWIFTHFGLLFGILHLRFLPNCCRQRNDHRWAPPRRCHSTLPIPHSPWDIAALVCSMEILCSHTNKINTIGRRYPGWISRLYHIHFSFIASLLNNAAKFSLSIICKFADFTLAFFFGRCVRLCVLVPSALS